MVCIYERIMIDATERKIRLECPLESPSPEAKNMCVCVCVCVND